MIDHTGIGVADVALSAKFYDAALGALGMQRVMQMPEGTGTDGIGYGVEYPTFWIPSDRNNQSTPTYYAAFVFDPDGNNTKPYFAAGELYVANARQGTSVGAKQRARRPV